MDPTILQFLIGVIGGTAAGFVGSKRAARKSRRRRSSARRSRVYRSRTRKGVEKSPVFSPKAIDSAGKLTQLIETRISTCPSCGLAGPDSLLAEHFLSSPSHPLGRREEERNIDRVGVQVVDDHNKDASHEGLARSLLSMLAPPRAFGHRHQQPIQQRVQETRLFPLPARLSMSRLPLDSIRLMDNS